MTALINDGISIIEGNVDSPKGFFATGIASGIKKNNGLDLGMIKSEVAATAAAVYTMNTFQAAPILVTREAISKEGKLQAVIVNSGNANACTGEKGYEDAKKMQAMLAQQLNIPDHFVGVASTGVIGQYLPMDKVADGIKKLQDAQKNGTSFSKAIMTTDTMEKTVCVQVEIDGKTVTIAGTAKGSGMIHPNMATMLGFVTTDASVEQDFLHRMLKKATDETYNMISVDGDTSTNDMVVVMANGMAENAVLSETHPQADLFYSAFLYVQRELAKKIARDGEGATKLVEVTVRHAETVEKARHIAKSVIGSNLVKTAIYGNDANWGRIICAVGYSGAKFDPQKIDIYLGPIQVLKDGMPVSYSEEEATRYLDQENVVIVVDLKEGEEQATAWGCDLTYDYIRINASYRT